jgi:O-antigen/teichoic acid export membrane protein
LSETSFKKRYVAKLFANAAGVVIALVVQMMVPRALGPKAYGNFSYLSNFFGQITSFLQLGTGNAFYTKLSKRQTEFGIIVFYGCFFLLTSGALLFLTFGAIITDSYSYIWVNQSIRFIVLAAGLSILVWARDIVDKIADAMAFTVSSEFIRVFQGVIGLIIIVNLFFAGKLNLFTFFLYNYVILIIGGLLLIRVILKKGSWGPGKWKLTFKQSKAYLSEFYDYSHPLIVYSLIALVINILDLWLLEYFAGSEQQGFYGLSCKIGAICFLFTSAMTPLLTREFSVYFEKKDMHNIALLFRQALPLLYAIAAYFACFVAVQADNAAVLFGGGKFESASLPLMLMAFYPISQTYGQLSGSLFMASNQTKLYRNINSFFMIIGVPLTYFMLAPASLGGLGAGATGLAVKILLIQFLSMNTRLFYNTRFLGLKYKYFLFHQILCVGAFIGLAVIASQIINMVLHESILWNFITSGIIYSILVGICVIFCPFLTGENILRRFILPVFKK